MAGSDKGIGPPFLVRRHVDVCALFFSYIYLLGGALLYGLTRGFTLESVAYLVLSLQNGAGGYDDFQMVVVDQKDGSIVLAGEIDGGLTDYDFSIVKLDSEGLPLWELQVMSSSFGICYDFNIDFSIVKLNPKGLPLWNLQVR